MQTELNFEIQLIPLNAHEQRAHDNAVLCAQQYRASETNLLRAIDQVDCLRLHDKFRETSSFDYCVKYLRLTPAVANYFTTVARKSRAIPEFRKAIENGDIPVSKAAKVCSVITSENHAEWIPIATDLSKNKLEKAVAEARPGKARHDSVKPVAKNITRLALDVSDEFLAKLKRAVDLESSRGGKSAARNEALEAALDAFLKQNDPLQKAERAEKRNSARAEKSSTPSKAKDTRAEAPAGKMSQAIRHKVNLRDKCRCQAMKPNGEKCESMRWIDVHHRVPKAAGGSDELENLITLCGAHHRQWHMHDDLKQV